jgi:hypothetical protein
MYSKLLKGKEGKFADGSDNFSALDVVAGYSLKRANREAFWLTLLNSRRTLSSLPITLTSHPATWSLNK